MERGAERTDGCHALAAGRAGGAGDRRQQGHWPGLRARAAVVRRRRAAGRARRRGAGNRARRTGRRVPGPPGAGAGRRRGRPRAAPGSIRLDRRPRQRTAPAGQQRRHQRAQAHAGVHRGRGAHADRHQPGIGVRDVPARTPASRAPRPGRDRQRGFGFGPDPRAHGLALRNDQGRAHATDAQPRGRMGRRRHPRQRGSAVVHPHRALGIGAVRSRVSRRGARAHADGPDRRTRGSRRRGRVPVPAGLELRHRRMHRGRRRFPPLRLQAGATSGFICVCDTAHPRIGGRP